jgi:hypothetical protein
LEDIGVNGLTEYEVVDWIHKIQVRVNMVSFSEEGNEFLSYTESVVSWPIE